ncbi:MULTISPECIES: type II toxin-antitoxin system RelE family toxin [unclassified Micromonospora]|uniref:type II toxin-antitoxin system RelE family toxin n=1 Tax=unclassified Micromonospora TaxID=2617518 RepID=UPI000FB3E340|nr:type II toxin-antitoxin system RelE/ParE family toxin [Micromonospora sp. Llam0]ROO50941.1 mRNA-degrading endonuclease RelE of RelBE toxin-antitoxin system [Micromonospora sp. Llam0]
MSQPSDQRPYQIRIAGPAARALAGRLPEKVATAVYEFVTTVLINNPHRLGKPLMLPPYEGTWSARRGAYRVLYEIDDERYVVTVTAVEHRGDAYRSR